VLHKQQHKTHTATNNRVPDKQQKTQHTTTQRGSLTNSPILPIIIHLFFVFLSQHQQSHNTIKAPIFFSLKSNLICCYPSQEIESQF